jgi:DNA helicase-4
VQKNPVQLKKNLRAIKTTSWKPVKVVLASYDDKINVPLQTALEDIFQINQTASVMILARYNFQLNDIDGEVLKRYKSLSISKRTVHAAKGSEAEFVIVYDVASGRYGFPSEIADDPLLVELLPTDDSFPFAEERRLFYVAITRCKERVYLLADESRASRFIDELCEAEYENEVAVIGRSHDVARCRYCSGRLTRRSGQYGTFWGCENYPICTAKGSVCPECKLGVVVVTGRQPKCNRHACGYKPFKCISCRDGFMVPRTGRYGPFFGCSTYPDCSNAMQKIPEFK